MRGEDMLTEKERKWLEETPPHAWGRHAVPMLVEMLRRNTPTCVGKTLNDH